MRVAIDVGGTFTDLCALDEATGMLTFVKDSTTPKNYAEGVIKVIRKSRLKGEQIDRFIGTGSTMVINALTEMKGAKVALVTTKGFRDVLEIQRSNRTDIYNFMYKKPKPIVPRHLRFEVDERMSYSGEVLRPFDGRVDHAVDACEKEGVESIAVALYNSYANPEHELKLGKILKEKLPGVHLTMSHELSREWREYERMNTAVMNAFVQPKVHQYLTSLEKEMRSLGLKIRLHVMQSNGGVTTFELGTRTPIYQVESGPIGGVIGAREMGNVLGLKNIITMDVGGTTAKTSLIDSGKIKTITEYSVGRTQFYPGLPVKVPVVDIVEIGAGGGSIVWLDELGSMKVGPQSAGADPGPACYDQGGTEPTLTDAFVLTGVIDPDFFLGGEIKLKKGLAEEAFAKVAHKLGISLPDAAIGAIRVATANMVNAIKLISVRRGYDTRDFATIAFGGGGPLFATSLASELEIETVIIPRVPGVFSAWGMLMTDLRHDYVRTKVSKLDQHTLKELKEILEDMMEKAYGQMEEEGIEKKNVRFEAVLDIRYVGQEHTVPTPVPIDDSPEALKTIEKRFHALHLKEYTFTLSDPLEVVNIHLLSRGSVKKPSLKGGKIRPQARPKAKSSRRAFVADAGFARIPVFNRDSLQLGATVKGPAVIEEATSTTVLRPGDSLNVDKFGNLVVKVR